MRTSRCGRVAVAVIIGLFPAAIAAQGLSVQSFTDVPPTHQAFSAVEYLRSKDIVALDPNGKFRPNDTLTRAQAAKVLMAPLSTPEQLAAAGSPGFSDVVAGSWYEKYVTLAVAAGIVNGPSVSATFRPNDPVTKAAFLKMLLSSKKADVLSAYSEVKTGLSSDMAESTRWEYPWMRYALVSSITTVDGAGKLLPEQHITRAQMAIFMHRYGMYLDGRRSQALLNETENNVIRAMQHIDAKNIAQARYAATRARLTALGALAMRPSEPIVKGAVKTAEGFGVLIDAFDAGTRGELALVIDFAKQAWALAAQAKQFSPGLVTIADQMQAIAASMASEARTLQAGVH